MSKRQLHLDLHPIAREGRRIDDALNRIMQDAIRARAKKIEIITGKGSGQLKKRVLKFLQQPAVAAVYHRIEVDMNNHGRVFVHFRW